MRTKVLFKLIKRNIPKFPIKSDDLCRLASITIQAGLQPPRVEQVLPSNVSLRVSTSRQTQEFYSARSGNKENLKCRKRRSFLTEMSLNKNTSPCAIVSICACLSVCAFLHVCICACVCVCSSSSRREANLHTFLRRLCKNRTSVYVGCM